jgi:hypothetical protein
MSMTTHVNNCLQNSVHADKGKILTEKEKIVRQKNHVKIDSNF